MADGHWRWVQGQPKIYTSTPGVERGFCASCGTPLSFRSQKMSGVMHLYLATLDEPGKIAPTLHMAIEEKLPWLRLGDDLPTHRGPDYTKARPGRGSR